MLKKKLLSGLLALSLVLISAVTVLPPVTVAYAAPVLSDVENAVGKEYINNGWTFIRTPDESSSGETISTVGYDDNAYTNAIIPGSALYSYYMAGQVSQFITGDIFYGDNMKILEEAKDSNGNSYYNCDYWYRTEVTIPSDYNGRRITLNFDGINRSGEVYVNGKSIGSVDGPFTRGSFDITDYVTAGQTAAIAVKAIWCQSKTTDTPCFIVLDGWDFSQPVPGRGTGVYKDVYLSSSAYVTVDDPFVYADLPLPDTSSADIVVSSEITNHSDIDVVGTVTGVITPGNIVFSETVKIPANSTYEFSANSDEYSILHVDNPLLWWPNGMGDQNLYNLSLSFTSGGTVSDGDDATFGIREFSYGRDPVSNDLLIYINGEKVMCRGGNWGLPDVLFSWDDEEFDAAIRMHKEMGFNMIRTWHGTSDWSDFYEACDKYGILVYEDFWLHGFYVMDLYLSEENQKMFIDNMIDKYKRLRNHACIALWCGENETYPPDYLYDPMVEYYEELDGTRLLIPVSNQDPVSGGIDYAIQDPSWYFGDRSVGFCTEVGAVCIPSYPSLEKMFPSSSLDSISSIVNDSIWQYHDLYESSVGNKHPDWYVNAVTNRYGSLDDSDMEGFAYQAQLVNYETYKAIMEGFSDDMFEGATGALLWMSQNTWPSTIWQTYDYYFEATGAYYGCMEGCKPLNIQWNSLSGAVKAVNSTADNYGTLTATANIYNLDGTLHHSMTKDIEVNKSSLADIFTLFPKSGSISGSGLSIASASASSSNGGDASLAIDGKEDTRWIANSTNNGEYLTLDLGSLQKVSAVEVDWETACASSYDIQVSQNGSDFTTVASASASGDGRVGSAFTQTDARYIRILCKSAGTMWAYSIWEVSVFSDNEVYTGDSGLSELCFIELKLTDSNGTVVSENQYWRANNNGTDYTALQDLSDVSLNATATYTQSGGSTQMTVTLNNPSSSIAFGTWVSAVDAAGDTILPAYYSDNYFFLTPGETKTITIDYDLLTTPTINIEGYNINAQTVAPTKVGGDDEADETLGEYKNIASSALAYDSNTGVVDVDGNILSAATTNLGYYSETDTLPENINDGDDSTSWQLGNYAHNADGEVMFGLALNTKTNIDKLVINWESGTAALENAYSVAYSLDGKTWSTASISISRDTTTDSSRAIDTVTLNTAVDTSFIKVIIDDYTQGDDAYKFSPKVFEMEVWGKEYISSGDTETTLPKVDYSAKAILEYVITQYPAINSADYTSESYSALSNAVTAANQALSSNTADEAAYASATSAVENAIAELDYNSLYILRETLAKAKEYNTYLYTNATANELKDAIYTAQLLSDSSSADDAANNNAIAALESAMAGLTAIENSIAPEGTVFDSISDGVRTGSDGQSGYYGNGNGEAHRSALNDKNYNTTWQYDSNSTENLYFGLSYDKAMIFTKLLLYFENGSRMKDDGFVVEVSDDKVNWTAVDITVSRNTDVNPALDTITFNDSNVSGKHIRVRVTGLATWYAPKFHEIGLYGLVVPDSADTDIAPYGTAFSSGGANISYINDKNSSTVWTSANVGTVAATAYAGIKFNETRSFDTVRIIYSDTSVNAAYTEMQYSSDGLVWHPVKNVTATAISGGVEFTFNAVKAQYFRAYVAQSKNAVTPKIASLEMYCREPLAENSVADSRYGLGAQIRENIANNGTQDMRFLLAYGVDEFESISENITQFGTLLVKTKDLGNDTLNLALAENADYTVKNIANNYLCNVYTDRYGVYFATTTITGISDFSCEYTVRGYYIANGITYYTDTITRCVNDGFGK